MMTLWSCKISEIELHLFFSQSPRMHCDSSSIARKSSFILVKSTFPCQIQSESPRRILWMTSHLRTNKRNISKLLSSARILMCSLTCPSWLSWLPKQKMHPRENSCRRKRKVTAMVRETHVLVIDGGPTLTHGGMPFGGWLFFRETIAIGRYNHWSPSLWQRRCSWQIQKDPVPQGGAFSNLI